MMTAKPTESTANALDDGIPSLYDELNRKTLETAIELISDYDGGRISGAQFYTGYQTLFKTVNGLASSEISGYAFEGSGMVAKNSDDSFASKRTFVKRDIGLIVISRYFGKDDLDITSYDADGQLTATNSTSYSNLEKICDRLTSLGYREVL